MEKSFSTFNLKKLYTVAGDIQPEIQVAYQLELKTEKCIYSLVYV